MGQRVDARDVLDANALTRRTVTVVVVGHFRPTGPNSWDDYEFVSTPEQPLEVRAGLEVQLEPRAPQFRLRREGRVLRCRWQPRPDEVERAGSEAPTALRELLLAEYLAPFSEEAAEEPAAFIVRKLED